MKASPAIVCAALLAGLAACTIGPTTDDGGTTSTSTTPRTRRDQCESVLSAFCQRAGDCALLSNLGDCVNGNLVLCCVGTACDATSTISESTVTACEQMIMAEDCNTLNVMSTMNPTACLGSQ